MIDFVKDDYKWLNYGGQDGIRMLSNHRSFSKPKRKGKSNRFA